MSRDAGPNPLVLLVLLMAQFLLGMAVNLFVDIPRNHPGANPPEYFSGVAQSVTWAILSGDVLLKLHAGLGLILVIAGLVAFISALRRGTRTQKIATGVGALSILAAGFNGGSFLNYNEDFSSMIMAGFFAVAVAAYIASLFFARETA